MLNEIFHGCKISEDWFNSDGVVTCFKNPTAEPYYIASDDGVIETLEGPVQYKKGFYIISGPKGEQYPIPPETFHKLKDDNGDGTATPKKIIKLAKLADHDGTVGTSWGEKLHYTKGIDMIVRHGKDDYGVVKKEIFDNTYTVWNDDKQYD